MASFENLIAEKTTGFVGREYVFSAIERFLESNQEGYFLIQGSPGSGKTAIVAEYVKRTGCLAHFNSSREGLSSASQFVESICTQLATRFSIAETTSRSAVLDDSRRLALNLKAAVEALPFGEKLVIAVDAIDEIDPSSYPPRANPLYLPATLPDRVYFILSGRTGSNQDFRFQDNVTIFDLDQRKEESTADIRKYVLEAGRHPNVEAWLAHQGLALQTFADIVSDTSAGDFIYARYLIEQLQTKDYKAFSATRLRRH